MCLFFINERLVKEKADFYDSNLKRWSLHRIEEIEKGSKSSFSHERRHPSIGVMLEGRSELRRGMSVRCYISVIKISISRFDA